MSDDQNFDKMELGSHGTHSIQAGSIKKGAYCMLKGFPCKVTQYSTAQPGKHGSAKSTIVGIDIFTGKQYEETAPTSANMQQPIVNKVQLEVANVGQDNFVTLIQLNGQVKNDLKLPVQDEEIYPELKKIWDQNNGKNSIFFTIISACGKEKIVSGRVKND